MVQTDVFERYLIEEFYDDYRDGSIDRGVFTRRVAFIRGSMAAAAVAMLPWAVHPTSCRPRKNRCRRPG